MSHAACTEHYSRHAWHWCPLIFFSLKAPFSAVTWVLGKRLFTCCQSLCSTGQHDCHIPNLTPHAKVLNILLCTTVSSEFPRLFWVHVPKTQMVCRVFLFLPLSSEITDEHHIWLFTWMLGNADPLCLRSILPTKLSPPLKEELLIGYLPMKIYYGFMQCYNIDFETYFCHVWLTVYQKLLWD